MADVTSQRGEESLCGGWWKVFSGGPGCSPGWVAGRNVISVVQCGKYFRLLEALCGCVCKVQNIYTIYIFK